MALKIRLARLGTKKKPFYRIVVAESTAKRDGRFLEAVGIYDPNQKPARVEIKKELLDKWAERGAQPTDTVRSLIKKQTTA
ncbi:MAG: 30S ribosomal protein S16 [Candidatus Adiutrix sp.]|nr:30S ribosomal protein S16 [Candidatus Adiutrix sp.]